MTSQTDIERYIKNPSLLIELCLKVVDSLDDGSENEQKTTMEPQLREISRAIEKLEKANVPVPDALREVKTRLAALLGANDEALQVLSYLAEEFEGLLSVLNDRIGKTAEKPRTRKSSAKRSKLPTTEKSILRELIVEAIKSYGGSASRNDVLNYLEKKLNNKLLPGDLEWRDGNCCYVWQHNASWERYSMTQDGILKKDSPRGVWEISEGRR